MISPAEHGLSQKAVEIGRLFGFPITNSKHVDLSSPHANVWERIRTDQEGTAGQGAIARGIVASIADYIISVQTK